MNSFKSSNSTFYSSLSRPRLSPYETGWDKRSKRSHFNPDVCLACEREKMMMRATCPCDRFSGCSSPTTRYGYWGCDNHYQSSKDAPQPKTESKIERETENMDRTSQNYSNYEVLNQPIYEFPVETTIVVPSPGVTRIGDYILTPVGPPRITFVNRPTFR